MAINPETQYPGKIAPSTPDYPYGAARNITLPGDGTGTPWEAALVNDIFGWQQALLSKAGLVPSGTPEKATASQYLEAMTRIVASQASVIFDTVADMQTGSTSGGNAVTLKTGDIVQIKERGNADFEVKSGTADGFSKLDTTTGLIAEYVWSDYINFAAVGGVGDGSTDNGPALEAAIQLAWDNGVNSQLPGSSVFAHIAVAIFLPMGGVYKISSLVSVTAAKAVNIIGGDRTAIIGDGASLPIAITGTQIRYLTIKNVWIQNFAQFLSAETANLDAARWTFEGIHADAITKFVDTVSYHGSRSTLLTFNECTFYSGVAQLGDLYMDTITFNQCWFQQPNNGSYFIKANGNTTFNNCMRIPVGAGATGSCFCLFTNDGGTSGVTAGEFTRNLSFKGMRNSNEGGNSPLVVADYPPVSTQSGGTPTINFDECFLNGFNPSQYESGGTETGIVHFLQYPAGVSFKACSFVGIGDDKSLIASKQSTLSEDANDVFRIEMDEISYANAKQVSSPNASANIALSMRQYINNPDPYLFRGILDDGKMDVVDSGTTGTKKATMKVRTGWTDPDYPAPASFLLNLSGFGRPTTSDLNYSGSAVYLVTIVGFFSGSHQARVTFTKLHGDDFGLNNDGNADIVSLHFGTGDTGSNTATRAVDYDVTVMFGTNIGNGMAKIVPYWTRGRKQKNLS